MADKSVILNLKEQIHKLIADHAKVTELCTELVTQRDLFKSENFDLKSKINRLNSELSQTQLIQGLAGVDNNRQKARTRVNRLMREVDKCIALVNKTE